jgi:alpha-galactosidase
VSKRGDLEVWARELHDGARAVVLFNRGAVDAEIGVSWPEIGYPARVEADVRDLWRHEDLGRFPRGWTTRVPAHGAVVVRVSP